MEKRFLEECLEKRMSLEAIGKEVGKHPSTVGYWLRKHGLTANNVDRHAPKGGLGREQLEALVDAGLTVREIAERLDRSGSNGPALDGPVRTSHPWPPAFTTSRRSEKN